MPHTLTVTAATGHVGGAVARRLIERGHRVRVLSRRRDRLDDLVELGAEPVVGDSDDPDYLAAAFEGADAAFLVLPPNTEGDYRALQTRVGEAITAAVLTSGLPRAVDLSSVGAQHASGTGPIVGIHEQEDRLSGIDGLTVLHLRAASFMENQLWSIDLIREQGINGSPLEADLPIPMVAVADIAERAAERLDALDFEPDAVEELLGPRDLTMNEATTLLGRAIGKPDLAYVRFPYEDAREAMVEQGMSEESADLMIEMYRGINEGRVASEQGRTPKSTTETDFETWAEEVFAPAYREQ